MLKNKIACALYLELASHGLCLRTGRVPATLPKSVAKSLWERVKANRAGLQAVILDRRDPDLDAVRQEGSGA